MSLLRLVFAGALATVSFFAINANAYNNAAAAGNANAVAANMGTASSTTANANQQQANANHSHKSHHEKASHAMAKVDLNNADASTLSKVKGISMKKAQAIVSYRAKNGAFKSIQDLKLVTNAAGKSLFSDKALARLQTYLMVSSVASAAPAPTAS